MQDEGVPEEGCRERYFDLREGITGEWRTLYRVGHKDLPLFEEV